MKRGLKIVNAVLFYGLLVLSIVLFLFNLSSLSTQSFAFASFATSWFLSWFLRKKKFYQERYFLIINLALWLGVAGEMGVYYSNLIYYDKAVHLLTGFIMSILAYAYFRRNLKVDKFFIFLVVVGLAGVWEILEYLIYIMFNIPTEGVYANGIEIMSRIDDTVIDMICDAVGSVLYLSFRKESSMV